MVALTKIPSRSDYDWRASKGPSKSFPRSFAGFVFACDESMIPDLSRKIFGLPAVHTETVRCIRRGMPLFLLNYTDLLLYGVYEAVSDGGYNIDPFAWEDPCRVRYSKPVSRYPAQVRIEIRNERPALEEKYFRSIIELKGNQLRQHELSAQQVQKLLQLFNVPYHTDIAKIRSYEPKSPTVTDKSDSDCLSDTSSKNVNSGEDDWNDESVYENSCCQKDVESSEMIQQNAMGKKKASNGCFSVSAVSVDNQGGYYYNSRFKRPQKSEHEKLKSSRFDDDDPAVNSNGFVQAGLDQSVAVSRQDNVVTMSILPSQVQAPTENLFLKSLKTIESQKQGMMLSSDSRKSRWAEKKQFRSSTVSIRRKEFSEDKYSRPKDQKIMKPRTCNDSEQGTHGQSQNFQLQSFPVCMHRSSHVHESNHVSPLIQHHFFCMPSVIARPPQHVSTGFVEELHYEILNFARCTRPSAEIQRHVEAAIGCVRRGVKAVWPHADIEVFGSFATGLCLQHSDVDLAVIDAQDSSSEKRNITQASASLIRKLAAALSTNDWCESINSLETASMPVLKCICRPFGSAAVAPSIAVDITIGSIKVSDAQAPSEVSKNKKLSTRHTGGDARDYVLRKIRELPALAPLVLLLKSFLHHKDLSNVYSGGLGSFSLTLLVAFFLEKVSVPPIDVSSDGCNSDSPTSLLRSSPLSCQSEFSDDSDSPSTSGRLGTSNSEGSSDSISQSLGEQYVRRAADAIERVLSLWDNGDAPYLGRFLLGFLHSFGVQRDLSRDRIVLKGIDGKSFGGIFGREDRHIALWIDDPLRPGVNIGAGSYGMVRVQTAFTEMQQVLTEGRLCTPLKCLDKHCQDLASITELKNLSRLMVEDKSAII